MLGGRDSTARHVLSAALVIVVAAWLPVALGQAGRWATLLDNVHWTVTAIAATLLTWHAARGAHGVERRVRWGFAAGLGCLTLGQLLWDVQVAAGWNPFPAPSDLFFVLLGPGFAVGVFAAMRGRLSAAQQRTVGVDVVGFALSTTTLVLTLYLPLNEKSSSLQLAMMTLYTASLLTTAAALLVVWWHLRQRWTAHNIALLGGLLGHAALWMIWNARTLDGTLGEGTLLNLAFSLATLLLGWGAAGWRLHSDISPAYDRLCEGMLRQLPLALAGIAPLTLSLLLLGSGMPEGARVLLAMLALGVLVFAIFRQTLQLGERERLLAAERAVSESQEQLRHQAHHDALTGLPNLALLRDRVEQALADARRKHERVALLFIDLDRFKEVNDSLGHAAGDRLLCHVAAELLSGLRAGDSVARLGGYEFMVVVRDLGTAAQAAAVAQKLLELPQRPFELEGMELSVSMSIGIALYPDDGADFGVLQQCADTAMYKAKAAGRNGYRFFDPQMNADAAERMRLRAGITGARTRGELNLVYQPQYELKSGRMVGVEALLRWDSATLGNISPSVFVPVAEDSGQIVELGEWVLHRACRDAVRWLVAGLPPVTVAVNLSVVQIKRCDIAAQVARVLRETGLPANRLELEITESVLLDDHDGIGETLDRLRALGVRLALDDFGSGYSSLSQVRRLAGGKLKIDRSLIAFHRPDQGDANIVVAAVQMARAMAMTSVAEGVETAAQAEFLAGIGCDHVQGYLYAEPVPLQRLEAMLAAEAKAAPEPRQRSGRYANASEADAAQVCRIHG